MAAEFDQIAETAISAVEHYEHECEERRKKRSTEVFGHPGAFIAEALPTRAGRKAAIVAALSSPPGIDTSGNP